MSVEYKDNNGINTIKIYNALYCPVFWKNIGKMIHTLTNTEFLFIGVYKTDGISLSAEDEKEYKEILQEYIEECGEVCEYSYKGKKRNDHYAIKLPNNAATEHIVEIIFKLYLETIIIEPMISWAAFQQSFRSYVNHGCRYYIEEGYARILFSYIDSSDFNIQYDFKRVSPELVHKGIIMLT